jgi:excisionase family DNA binding protein
VNPTGRTARGRSPSSALLSTAEFLAAVNPRRPLGAQPLTLRTLQRCIAAGEVEAYRPGKRRWKIPEREVARFTREHRWQRD